MNDNIRDLFNMSFDGGDPWGSVMAHWFGVANTLFHRCEAIPPEWQYQPGVLCSEDNQHWPDAEYLEMYDNGDFDAQELRHAGNVFARYARLCEHKGLSY